MVLGQEHAPAVGPADDSFHPSTVVDAGLRLGDHGVASHAGELTTVLACLAISMLSAITTSPKVSPGAPPPGGEAIAPGADRSAERLRA